MPLAYRTLVLARSNQPPLTPAANDLEMHTRCINGYGRGRVAITRLVLVRVPLDVRPITKLTNLVLMREILPVGPETRSSRYDEAM